MDDRDWSATEQALQAVLPARDRDLARLRVLLVDRPPPTITVVGKYNHGKSRLLNELSGSPVFAVADRRETVTLADHDRAGLRWLDAPGP
jgi:GTP-binding protein EngB required for normal cell division